VRSRGTYSCDVFKGILSWDLNIPIFINRPLIILIPVRKKGLKKRMHPYQVIRKRTRDTNEGKNILKECIDRVTGQYVQISSFFL